MTTPHPAPTREPMSAEHVAALAEDVWNDFEGSPFITITHRDAESIARSVLASPAMRDLLADERARALREAADEARVRGDIGPTEGYAS